MIFLFIFLLVFSPIAVDAYCVPHMWELHEPTEKLMDILWFPCRYCKIYPKNPMHAIPLHLLSFCIHGTLSLLQKNTQGRLITSNQKNSKIRRFNNFSFFSLAFRLFVYLVFWFFLIFISILFSQTNKRKKKKIKEKKFFLFFFLLLFLHHHKPN
jgi:hypothetical protein